MAENITSKDLEKLKKEIIEEIGKEIRTLKPSTSRCYDCSRYKCNTDFTCAFNCTCDFDCTVKVSV